MTEPAPASRSDVLCSPWATPADVPDEYDGKPLRDRLTDEQWEVHLLVASEILWALSGRRWYGTGGPSCTEEALYRSVPPTAGRGSWPYHSSWGACPCWLAGSWNADWLFPPDTWRGTHYEPVAIQLPRQPVTAVLGVTIDGQPFDDWRLSRNGWLERTDGAGWDGCHDTTIIDYTFGEPPPEGGVRAAVALAAQLALAELGDNGCQLPERVQSITRQGISMAILDPMEFLPNGRTGLYAVDLWLAAVNPLGRPARGFAWSPDIPVARRS